MSFGADHLLREDYMPAVLDELNRPSPLLILPPSRDDELVIRRNWYASAFAVLNGLDVATTTFAIHLGAHEANPIVAPIAHSLVALLAVKVAFVCAFLLVVRRAPLQRGYTAAVFATGLYTAVVVSNILTIQRLTHTP